MFDKQMTSVRLAAEEVRVWLFACRRRKKGTFCLCSRYCSYTRILLGVSHVSNFDV